MLQRNALRLAATLLFAGEVIYLVAGLLHPDREPANLHPAVFAEYAESTRWTLVHLGQFAGMAVIIAGLVALYVALDVRQGAAGWLARFGLVSAVAALALYGVLQGVDGVALKQSVDAWSSASEAEKAARFASAESIRWLEWGVRSYQSLVLGMAFVFYAAASIIAARFSRIVGVLMALTGVAYIVQGFVIGNEGFSDNNSVPTLLGYSTWVVWTVWLLVAAWRSGQPAGSEPSLARVEEHLDATN